VLVLSEFDDGFKEYVPDIHTPLFFAFVMNELHRMGGGYVPHWCPPLAGVSGGPVSN